MRIGKIQLPKWLLVAVLVAAGAGAAVGPTLAPRLLGRVAVTATQALTFTTPTDVVGLGIPALPAGARFYASNNDTRTQFTVALDMFATSSLAEILAPVNNASNNQVLSLLTLNVPDGMTVDIHDQPGLNGNSIRIGRLSANTWEIDNPAGVTVNVYLDLALANGTPPGFYTITGSIQPENV